MSTKIEYNGSIVATVEGGNKATIPVRGKKMATDILVTVPKAEVIPDHTDTDFALHYSSEDGAINVVYSSTEKASFDAAPDGAVIDSFGDRHFTPSNIKSGVSIFGIEGTYEGETDSAVPTEVSTEAEMTALLESGEVGGVYKYTGTTGTYENGAFYVLEEDPLVGTWIFNSTVGTNLTANANFVTSESLQSSPFGVLNYNGNSRYLICDWSSDGSPYFGISIMPANNSLIINFTDSESNQPTIVGFSRLRGAELVLYDNIYDLDISDEFVSFMNANATKQ